MTSPAARTAQTEDDWRKLGIRLEAPHDRVQFFSALEFIRFLPLKPGMRVADVGSGPGHQAAVFSLLGCDVTCVDFVEPRYSWLRWVEPGNPVPACDLVWSHHCLEHIPDPIAALRLWHSFLKPNGLLALTVPEFGLVISSGHINSYSLPLLLYHLAAAGFGCRTNPFQKSRSHLRACVPAVSRTLPDTVDLRELAARGLFSPSVTESIEQTGRFDASAMHLNWFGERQRPAPGGVSAYDYLVASLWR